MSDEATPVRESRATPRGRSLALVVAGVLVVATFAGLTLRRGPDSAPPRSGPVDVLYAGSLLTVVQQVIGPAFHRATGYSVQGIADGSSALTSQIKGGTEVADVFVSASPSADRALEGTANGNWVSSFAVIGTSPLVLGYNPASSFASALVRQPWYDVVDQPGFLLGRTDPSTDPKGMLAVTALDHAARRYHRPALAALARSATNVFAETSLVGELQAGQLDAGFFYGVEASAAHLRTVTLGGVALGATYTVAVVNRAPHARAARAFRAFLLGPQGRAILRRHGIVPPSP